MNVCPKLIVFLAASVSVQAQPMPPLVSPEVRADRSVTFRLSAPNAKSVLLALGRSPAHADEEGISAGLWSLTTAPLAPDIYGYAFMVDGQAFIDPSNWRMKPNLINTQSAVLRGRTPPQLWEETDVPHGEIHHHFYRSSGDRRGQRFLCLYAARLRRVKGGSISRAVSPAWVQR